MKGGFLKFPFRFVHASIRPTHKERVRGIKSTWNRIKCMYIIDKLRNFYFNELELELEHPAFRVMLDVRSRETR